MASVLQYSPNPQFVLQRHVFPRVKKKKHALTSKTTHYLLSDNDLSFILWLNGTEIFATGELTADGVCLTADIPNDHNVQINIDKKQFANLLFINIS